MTAAASLAVVRPLALTDAMLVSCDVPEADYGEWNSGTTYGLAARVIMASTHKVYESLQAANTNKNPTTQTLWWAEVSPTNRWKAWDTSNTTQTAQASSISYTIEPGRVVTSVSALNLTNATSLRVRMVDPVYGTVYDVTTSLAGAPSSSSWWTWLFGDRVVPSVAVLTDLPSFPAAQIIIDLVGGADLAVGVLVLGKLSRVGSGVRYGARVGYQDYSRSETNSFGDSVFVQRAYAKRASFDMRLVRAEVDAVFDLVASLRAVPCLWIGSVDYGSMILYGTANDFSIVIAYANYSDCSLDLRGLT